MRNEKNTRGDSMTPALVIAGVVVLIALVVGAVALLFVRNSEGKTENVVSNEEALEDEKASVFPWKNKD